MKWYSKEVYWVYDGDSYDWVAIEGTEKYLGEYDKYITTEEDAGKIIYCEVSPKKL